MSEETTKRRPPAALWLLAVLVLAAGSALVVGRWSGDEGSGAPHAPEATVQASTEEADGPAAPAPPPEPPTLSEDDALRGSIKTVTCSPERAGEALLSNEEMSPSHEAVQAMEGCLDHTASQHRTHRAIELTIVYYLTPDGAVSDTGVGADVDTEEAWKLLEPCVGGYWQTFPPKVSPSDERSFSCVYTWSENTLAGGIASVQAHVARVWAGRDTAPFGSSVVVDEQP